MGFAIAAFIAWFVALSLSVPVATAAPTIASIISDHAVIQRGRPVTVTGGASPGEQLVVKLGGNTAATVADHSGFWRAVLPPLSAGGPYDLVVTGAGGSVAAARDILVGDVWLCSGQSNMELAVRQSLDFDNQAATFPDTKLRLLTIEKGTAIEPHTSFAVAPKWVAASRVSVPEFSAACYYMARDLRAIRGVPIGAIDATWGGTQIRAWLDPAVTRAIYGQAEADLLSLYGRNERAANRAFLPKWSAWWRKLSGDQPGSEPWNMPDKLRWTPFPAISFWDEWIGTDFKTFNGYVWARRTVTLTAEQARQATTLSLGVIDDADQTFVNGKVVGNTFSWSDARHYKLPAGFWRTGTNELVTLVGDSWGNGGFQGPADQLRLEFSDGSAEPLGQGWRYAIATTQSGSAPRPPWDQIAGLGLIHNAMVAPLGALQLDGVAWYQGESDVGMTRYDNRLKALIASWRQQFGRADLPVLVVGLANFGPPANAVVASGWAQLRNEQRHVADTVQGVTLVPTIDLGERLDIHPANKIELGHRLSRAAEGKPFPRVIDAVRHGRRIVVRFAGVTSAWAAWSSSAAIGFELCGATQESCRYVSGLPKDETVEIDSDGEPATRVRYAWADAPVINLFDAANLPVSSFEVPID